MQIKVVVGLHGGFWVSNLPYDIPYRVQAIMIELDRRWGRLRVATFKGRYRAQKCPFMTGRMLLQSYPPFYSEVDRGWANGRGYGAWVRFYAEHGHKPTRRIATLLRNELRKKHLHFSDEHFERLVKNIQLGVQRPGERT